MIWSVFEQALAKTHEQIELCNSIRRDALFGQKNVILVFESVWDAMDSCLGLLQSSEVVSK